jgi:glutamate racemase
VASGLARHLSEVPVHDLISCASTYAAANFENIGVIATSITCRTRAFSEAIQYKNPRCRVLEIPCPDLVPLVEKGILDGPVLADTIAKYTNKLREAQVDSLIFGCTHFPFLEEAFRKQLPDTVRFIDPAWTLGREIFSNSADEFSPAANEEAYRRNTYFCTGDAEKFASAAEFCLRLSKGSLRNSVVSLPLEQLQPADSSKAVNTVVLQSSSLSPGAAAG